MDLAARLSIHNFLTSEVKTPALFQIFTRECVILFTELCFILT